VEGQLTQVSIRPNANTVFMVLRDPAADMSMSVTCSRDLVARAPVKLTEGTQVVVCGKPQFYTGRGTFSLRLSEIRAVGLGELLARIEMLRGVLAAEGLFDARLKRPLPFLPNLVGLITGRGGAAEHDVTKVAEARWPAVRFEIRNTAVQGPTAVAQIVEALRDLDGHPDVDVIVIARGGGSVEDLLPFSDETLCRAIAACRTPVVSAVGHEPDNPLCDLVADLRAATPTDAAKKVVPDTAAELALVADLRRRSARALRSWVGREQHSLTQLRSRPCLADPLRLITDRGAEVERALATARRDVTRLVNGEADRVGHLAARLATLGPAATLARGYAVVQTVDGPASILRPTPRRAPRCASEFPTARSVRSAPGGRMEPHERRTGSRDGLRAVPRRTHRGGAPTRAGRHESRCGTELVGARRGVGQALPGTPRRREGPH
jgi:exodeoxyribonuclease VII large subunit